jgi:uncharacterized protein YndB with AHSA1/START domain
VSENSSLEREIYIDALPEVVFGFFTDADKLALWLGRQATLEPMVDGQLRVEVNETRVILGKFIELVPYRLIVFTWGWEGHATIPPGSSTVEVSLESKGDGTHLRITHRGLPNEQENINHARAWEPALARLAACARDT